MLVKLWRECDAILVDRATSFTFGCFNGTKKEPRRSSGRVLYILDFRRSAGLDQWPNGGSTDCSRIPYAGITAFDRNVVIIALRSGHDVLAQVIEHELAGSRFH